MTTSLSARSATSISTGDVPTNTRPTATVAIGTGSYTVRAPKMDVWREVSSMLFKIDLAKHLNDLDDPTADEEAQRASLLVELSDLAALSEAIVTGREEYDAEGNLFLIGGFLRRCLGKENWPLVRAEWKDDDSDLDLDSMFAVARAIQAEFLPWYTARQASMGLPPATPEPPAARKPKAVKTPKAQ